MEAACGPVHQEVRAMKTTITMIAVAVSLLGYGVVMSAMAAVVAVAVIAG